MSKILIMGLPGSGKTTLASKLFLEVCKDKDSVFWINADAVRQLYNDWDFSSVGRLRQAKRMCDMCGEHPDALNIVDFIAPTEEIRNVFKADFVIWMNTISKGRFDDTNRVFEPPSKYDLKITNFNYSVTHIASMII